MNCIVFADDGEKIVIEQVTPDLVGDSLVVSAQFKNLFSQKIVGTIQSGLPSIIQIEIKLLQANDKSILQKFISRKIAYDIWAERYLISSRDTTEVYTKFDDVEQNCSRLESEKLVAKSKLATNNSYSVQIRVGIVPISTLQAEKVSDWLEDPNQTEEFLASENRTSGFELNLNKLLSFFINSKKQSRYNSAWFSSKSFTIQQLQ